MYTESQKYNFTSQGYLSYDKKNNGLRITQKRDPKEYSSLLERMKAIKMEFQRGQLSSLKEDKANELIEKITTYGNFEYFEIELGGKVSKLPRNLMNHQLKYLRIHVKGTIDLSDVLPTLQHLEKLLINAEKIVTGDFSTLKNLKTIGLVAKEWVDDYQVENIKSTQSLYVSVDKLKHNQYQLADVEKLETLSISTHSIDLTQLQIKNPSLLTELSLKTEEIKGIGHFLNYNKLEKLKIQGNIGEQLTLDKMQDLKLLELNLLNCSTIHLENAKQLEELKLHVPSSLVSYNSNLFNLPSQKIVLSGHLERLNGQQEIELNADLQELLIQSESTEKVDLPQFSAMKVSSLFLDIKNLECFDKSFKNFPGLGEIEVKNLSSDMNLTRFENLRKIKIDQAPKSETVCKIHYAENPNLKEIRVSWLRGILSIDDLPENVEYVNFDKCYQVKDISTSKVFKHLKLLDINSIDGKIKLPNAVLPQKVDISLQNFPSLETVILCCKTIEYVAPSITTFDNIKVYNKSSSDHYEKFGRYFDIHNKYQEQLSQQEKEALYHFVIAEHKSEVPLKYRQVFFSLYGKNIPVLNQYLEKYYVSLNPEGKKINEYNFKGDAKKIILLGNTSTRKTQLKEDVKNLNWQATTKVEQADIILLGKKYQFKSTPSSHVFFCTEKDLVELCKATAPKYLENQTSDNTTLVENVKELLMSNTIENELLALELIKNGGMPEQLRGYILFVAKCSKENKVRTKYRNYLKGIVSEGEKRFLSLRLTQTGENNTFVYDDLRNALEPKILDQFMELFYPDHRNFWIEALKSLRENKQLRRSIIDDRLFSQLSRRPSTLGHIFTIPFYKDELEYVLSNRMFGDNLVRIRIEAIDHLPEKILNFPNIKHVSINKLNMADFTGIICKLTKIQELALLDFRHNTIPSDIGALKNLKQLRIYNNIQSPIKLPKGVFELKKLESVQLNGKYYPNWQEVKHTLLGE
ncbi:leucine-rich repeat domain-containing protein [Flammeovirga aprica]|uniref:Leucine-rich repeat domain-containing protein n=1 Tax=Flammeovirga aprica JL-4 TaxID=694437 RepID=A0A7X9RUY1_9BACT|nr:hypothetical protein [Flammeovirga aprica]NME69173.1 hypothetical protein [Flammeovirga aprica JL-4]